MLWYPLSLSKINNKCKTSCISLPLNWATTPFTIFPASLTSEMNSQWSLRSGSSLFILLLPTPSSLLSHQSTETMLITEALWQLRECEPAWLWDLPRGVRECPSAYVWVGHRDVVLASVSGPSPSFLVVFCFPVAMNKGILLHHGLLPWYFYLITS